MRNSLVVGLTLVVLGWGAPARAVGGSATDQAVSLVYGSGHWDETPDADLLGVDSAGDPLFEAGWWYRVDGDPHEFPMPAPDTETYLDGRISATWSNLGGKNFAVEELTFVIDNEGPSGGFMTTMIVHNNNSLPKGFMLFHYVDVDLAGNGSGDSGVLVGPDFMKFTDGASSAFYRADYASHFRVAAFPLLRDALNDPTFTTLDDGGLGFGPGDATAAFQIDLGSIPAGSASGSTVSLFVNLSSEHVKGNSSGVSSFPDLLGQKPGLAYAYSVRMRRTQQLGLASFFPAPSTASRIMGVDDFDGNLVDELVWRDLTTGETYIGYALVSGAPTLPLNWKLSATGDFNGDGKADLLWRNVTSQKLVVWTMNGAAKTGGIVPVPDQAVDGNWEVAGAADFDGDGLRDLLWYNQTTGKIVLWYLDASLIRSAGLFTTPAAVGDSNWKVVAVGDFGKGPATAGTPLLGSQDIVWQNDASLKIVVWHMDHSAQRTGGVFTTPDSLPPGYVVVGPR